MFFNVKILTILQGALSYICYKQTVDDASVWYTNSISTFAIVNTKILYHGLMQFWFFKRIKGDNWNNCIQFCIKLKWGKLLSVLKYTVYMLWSGKVELNKSNCFWTENKAFMES